MSNPETAYLRLKGELQTVLALPLEGKKDQFRGFLVGYLMVEHRYSRARALSLVAGSEAVILIMLVEGDELREE